MPKEIIRGKRQSNPSLFSQIIQNIYSSEAFAATLESVVCKSEPPFAEVWLDGADTGERSTAEIWGIAPGSHTVTFKKGGYQDATANVNVIAGQTAQIYSGLVPISDSIGCSSVPTNAEVWLDGSNTTKRSEATLTGVAAGAHTITFKKTGYQDKSVTVQKVEGQTAQAYAVLDRAQDTIDPTKHAARSTSIMTPYAEEDNINVPLWGYTSAYRITSTVQSYYPLASGTPEKCSADWTGFLPHPPPYIVYSDSTGKIRYAIRGLGTTGNWWRRPPLTFTTTGGGLFITTAEIPSGTGNSYIVFYDSTTGDLKCMYEPSTPGQDNGFGFNNPITLDSTGDVGKYVSMFLDGAVDTVQHPHVAYYDATGGNLKFIENVSANPGPTTWSAPVTLDSTGDVGKFTGIAGDSKTYSHIAYYDVTNGNLKYIAWTDTGWSTPLTVDAAANDVGQYASIAVDPSDYPHIAYYDATAGDLKYVKKTSSGWGAPEVVDSTGDVGKYASLGIDSQGNPHIAYYDATGGNLKYAKKTGGSWAIATVDSTGDVGKGASLKIYRAMDIPRWDWHDADFIGYYDATNTSIKFVYKKAGGTWSTPEVITSVADGSEYLSVNFAEYAPPAPTSPGVLYTDGNIVVEAKREGLWWREQNMAVEVIGGTSAPSVDLVTIAKRVSDVDDWPQIMALYSSSHLRVIPHPLVDTGAICFGSSVLIGAAPESEWPAADIEKVVIDPVREYMKIYSRDGGSALLTWRVERGKTVVDVTNISFNTIDFPFATFRSMWMRDDKNVLAYVDTPSDTKHIFLNENSDLDWSVLYGDIWQFYRKEYCYYNTSNPNTKIEVLSPTGYFLISQAEDYSSIASGFFTKVNRASASKGQTLKAAGGGDEAVYNLNFAEEIKDAVIDIRYTDNVGNGTVEVFLDNVSEGTVASTITTNMDTYNLYTSQFKLADSITAGAHTLKLKVTSTSGSLELDYFAIHSAVTIEPLMTFTDAFNSGVWFSSDSTAPLQYVVKRTDTGNNHSTIPNEVQHAVKVDYNKANGDTPSEKQYGYFGVQFAPTNFSQYDYLSFWVFNDGRPLTFRIRLEDTTGGIWESNWAGFEPSMKTSRMDWENLVVDLTRTFGATGINMGGINKIIFIVDPGNTTSTGTFWLDDVTLLKAPKEAPIDVFETDHYGWSTAAVGAFTVALSPDEFHNEGDADSLGNRSLKVSWSSKNLKFHNIVYDVTHDANAPLNRIGNLPDLIFDGNSAITMWVKSTTDNNFQISAKVFDVEPGVNGDGEPTGGHGVDIGIATYTGAGKWQKLSWYYGGKAEAANAKVIYFFPFYNVPDDGGTFYIDDVNLEFSPSEIPALQQLLKELDEIIAQIQTAEIDIETIAEGLVAAGASYYIIKFVKDYLEGLKAKEGVVKEWKKSVTNWARLHPNTTFFGLLWLTRGVFLYETTMNVNTAFLDTAPLSSQSLISLGFGLGYLGGLNLAFANLSRLMISQLLNGIINNRVMSYMDYSAGIPNAQRTVAFWPGAFFDLQLAEENGKTVKSEAATRQMFKNVFDKIKNAIDQNPDLNNNIIYEYISDSRSVALNIEKEEAQIFIDWLKTNRPNVKFAWLHRKPVFYPLIDATGGYRGRELKGGAIVEHLQWLMNDIPGESYREIGTEKMWNEFLGTHTKDQIFGTAASQVPIENYFSIDAGDYPGPGAIRKMVEVLGHPDNALYPMISPDCVIGNIDDSLLTPLFGRARREMRAVEWATWKIYGIAPSYGKFGGKVGISYDVWKKHPLPEQSVLGEDLPMGMMMELEPAAQPQEKRYKVGYAEQIKVYEEGPTSLIAEKMTAIKWSYQDFTTAPMGGFNVKQFPYFTDKIPTVSGEYITPIKDYYSRWRIKSNLFARLGDPALLTLFSVDLISKLNPGYLGLDDPMEAMAAYVASMVSLAVIPRIDAWYKEEGVKGVIKRTALDTPVITTMMLEGIIDKSWHLVKGLKAYRANDSVFNIPRPSLVEYQFKPKFFVSPITIPGVVEADREGWKRSVIGNTWKSLAVGQGVIWYSVLTGEPLLSWYGLPFYLSWGGGAQALTWIYARKDWQEAKKDFIDGGKNFYNWVKALMKKGFMEFLKNDAAGVPGEKIKETGVIAPTEVIEDTLAVTYDLNSVRYDLFYDNKNIGSVSYKLSGDGLSLMIDTLTVSVDASVPITAKEAARWLILHSYQQITKTNQLLETPPPSLTTIAAKTWLGTETWDALQSLVTDGYLTYLGESGGYKNYQIQASMLSASFTISEKGVPSTTAVSGTQALPTVNVGTIAAPINVISSGEFRGRDVIIEGDKIRLITSTDTYTLDKNALLQAAQGAYGVPSVEFKLIPAFGAMQRTVKITSTQLLLDGTYTFELATADVNLKQLNFRFWLADVTTKTEAAADAIITQAGGPSKFKYLILSQDTVSGTSTAIWLETADIKLNKLSWNYLKSKLTGGQFNIYDDLGNSAGYAWLQEQAGKVKVKGKVFMPESAAKDGVIDLQKLLQEDIARVKAAGGITSEGVTSHELLLAKDEAVIRYYRQNVASEVTPGKTLGQDVHRVDTIYEAKVGKDGKVSKTVVVNAQEVVEPIGWKKTALRALRFISTPTGTATLVGGGNIIFLYSKYESDKYHPADEFYGDIIGATANTAYWTISQALLNRLSENAAARSIVGVAGGTVWLLPMIVVGESVRTFSREFYVQWQAGSDLYKDDKGNSITASALTTLDQTYNTVYRAWLATLDSLKKDWIYMFSPYGYGSGVRTTIEKDIADAIQNRWFAEDPEGKEAQRAIDELNKQEWRTPEYLASLQEKANKADDHYFLALETAKVYGGEYERKIIDALYNGLSWVTYGLYDEYGWARIKSVNDVFYDDSFPFDPANPLAGAGPAPLGANATQQIKDILMKNTYDLWRNFAEGWGTVDPIAVHLGYTPSIDEVLDWTLVEVMSTKDNLRSHLDGKWKSWLTASGPQHKYNVDFVGGAHRWLDIRTTLTTLDDLLTQMETADFLNYGLYTTLLPNTDLEYTGLEDISVATYKIEPPQSTFTLPNEVVFNGVKYYWDVKANNVVSGESPASERWGFIGQ